MEEMNRPLRYFLILGFIDDFLPKYYPNVRVTFFNNFINKLINSILLSSSSVVGILYYGKFMI